MKMNEIINLIRTLAQSQGFYGRLHTAVLELRDEDPDGYEKLTKEWEAQNFQSALDFILYIEQ